MSSAVKLPSHIVNDAKTQSKLHNRSVPKQIEHWYEIGKIAEENPDLPYRFVKDILIAQTEAEVGEVTEFCLND